MVSSQCVLARGIGAFGSKSFHPTNPKWLKTIAKCWELHNFMGQVHLSPASQATSGFSTGAPRCIKNGLFQAKHVAYLRNEHLAIFNFWS
eukprot:s406_g27.t1